MFFIFFHKNIGNGLKVSKLIFFCLLPSHFLLERAEVTIFYALARSTTIGWVHRNPSNHNTFLKVAFRCKMASWYVFHRWSDATLSQSLTMYFPIGWPKCLKRVKDRSAIIRHVVSSCDRMFFAVITRNSVTLWYSKVRLIVNTSASWINNKYKTVLFLSTPSFYFVWSPYLVPVITTRLSRGCVFLSFCQQCLKTKTSHASVKLIPFNVTSTLWHNKVNKAVR